MTAAAVKTMMLTVTTAAIFAGMSACGSNNNGSNTSADSMNAAPAPDATINGTTMDTGMNNINNTDTMNNNGTNGMESNTMNNGNGNMPADSARR